MKNQQIIALMKSIVEDAYARDPRLERFAWFSVDFLPEYRKSFDSAYANYTVYVYNLHNHFYVVMLSILHGLAHHIDYIKRKGDKHGESFYAEYYALFKSAIKLGIICRANLLRVLRRYYCRDRNKLLAWLDNTDVIQVATTSSSEICVPNGFDVKDRLIGLGFRFYAQGKCWIYQGPDADVQQITSALRSEGIVYNVSLPHAYLFHAWAHYMKVSVNAYSIRDELKKQGFIYVPDEKAWFKKYDEAIFSSMSCKWPDVVFTVERHLRAPIILKEEMK